MDEMKLKLSTTFLRGIVSKIISRMIYKKYGCKLDIQLNDLIIKYSDGKARLCLDVESEIKSEDFMKIVKSIGLD